MAMQIHQLKTQADALRQAMQQAEELAEAIFRGIPGGEEPALRAQANVLRAFLHQTSEHQKRFSGMISAREKA